MIYFLVLLEHNTTNFLFVLFIATIHRVECFGAIFFSSIMTSFVSCIPEHLLDLFFGFRICLHSFVLNCIFFYFVFKPSHLNYLNVSVSSKGCLISFPILLYNFIVSVIAKPIVNLIWIIFYSISTWCVVSKIHFWEFLLCSLPISSCGQNE